MIRDQRRVAYDCCCRAKKSARREENVNVEVEVTWIRISDIRRCRRPIPVDNDVLPVHTTHKKYRNLQWKWNRTGSQFTTYILCTVYVYVSGSARD